MTNPDHTGADADTALVPLCVDLDGTLVRTDTLVETALSCLFRNPLALFRLPSWLAAGRAVLKQELAARARIDVALLPYNENLINFLRQEKAGGRKIVLATAADKQIALAVADHLGLFDEIIASDGVRNLKGETKAAVLVDRFGDRGFWYAGNDRADVAVWSRAAASIPVCASSNLTKLAAAASPIQAEFGDRRLQIRAIARSLRPYQWAKNALVFVPVVTSGTFADSSVWMAALVMFLAFSSTASGIYVLNDLADLDADRQHARKRKRPFASGDLSPIFGMIAAPVLVLSGWALADLMGSVWVLIAYALLSSVYSFWLKEKPLVDVFILATLYSMRLFAGGQAIDQPVSFWLLAFASFFFLGLALVKRVSELIETQVSSVPRRGYRSGDQSVLQQMGVATGFVACMVLALYVQSNEVAERYANPAVLWAIVPLILFWQCRLWLATLRGQMHDDPLVFAARDWVSRAVLVATGMTVLLATLL